MKPGFLAVVACLLSGAGAHAAEAASGASSPLARAPRLDNSRCDAYRSAMLAVRSPKDLGKVVLRVDVSAQGEVVGAEIVEHTTSNYFAHVVQDNFSTCRFAPALENGQPVPGRQVLSLVFTDHPPTPNDATCPVPSSRERAPATGPMAATTVRVRFTRAGRVEAVDVLQASGVPALDEAAVTAYRQCHFDPDAPGQPAFQEAWTTTLNWSP